jgi:Novel STAND NTPase 1
MGAGRTLAGPDWRLIVTDEKDGMAAAEVTHETLLKTWTTLGGWLQAERDFLVWCGELDARHKDYENAGEAGPDKLAGPSRRAYAPSALPRATGEAAGGRLRAVGWDHHWTDWRD